jgi:ribosome modulation factor
MKRLSPRQLRELRERGYQCGLCGQPVDRLMEILPDKEHGYTERARAIWTIGWRAGYEEQGSKVRQAAADKT